jgi:carbon-monoxide dehydrogenase medium subunit
MEYFVPGSLDEAIALLSRPGSRALAGGTDLACVLSESLSRPERLVDLTKMPELLGIAVTADGIEIGACVAITDLAEATGIPRCLAQGARSIGSPQIRNVATIGGNVCNASPCGDTLSPLVCLDAVFILASREGKREVAARDFFLGPKKTVLRAGEILVSVRIGAELLSGSSAFRMIGKRNGQAISQVNAAVWLKLESGSVVGARACAGSVAPVPIRLSALEGRLLGALKHEAFLRDLPMDEIEALVNADIRPISDVRATVEYRKSVTAALFRDAIEEALS